MYCAVMSTVSSANMDEFPDIIDLVVEKNVDVFAFGRYCPTGGQNNRKNQKSDFFEEYHIPPLDIKHFWKNAGRNMSSIKTGIPHFS